MVFAFFSVLSVPSVVKKGSANTKADDLKS